MQRYKLLIEYDGLPYAGWQRQDGPKTVQGAIEAAVKAFSGENVTLVTAGRTDAGVHARGAVAHMDLRYPLSRAASAQSCAKQSASAADEHSAAARSAESSAAHIAAVKLSAAALPPAKICAALNAHLRLAGESVSILAAEKAAEDFNARFSALKRHYLYLILNRRAPPALDAGRAWWLPYRLNAEYMNEAAQCLLGKHDFTTFRAAQCQAKSPVRSLDRLEVRRRGEFIEIYAVAQSFLHNQVRSMVGSLAEVGRGKWSKEDLKQALAARSRARCGQVAPPYGLYLMQVDYP